MANRALLIVDVQNDFLSGGSLEVAAGDEIIPLLNRLQEIFELVIATRDWHPKNHKSFSSQHRSKEKQILWPDHCVQNSFGSEFSSALSTARIARIFYKGTDKDIDSYSGFLDNDKKKNTGLAEYLKQRGVKDIYIAGLATDYCVKHTALDGKSAGFNIFVIQDACRGVGLEKGDIEKAFKEMEEKGINIIKSEDIEKR